MNASCAPFLAYNNSKIPSVIIVDMYKNGFLAKLDSYTFYYNSIEDCAKEVYPCIRYELTTNVACAGNC